MPDLNADLKPDETFSDLVLETIKKTFEKQQTEEQICELIDPEIKLQVTLFLRRIGEGILEAEIKKEKLA
jgi:hypothetical protein